jgi:hypothetical protein
MGALRGEHGGGAPLLGTLKDMYKKVMVPGISLYGGTWKGDFFTGDFERQVKEGSGNGASLSVGALRGETGRRAPLLETYKDI